MILNLAKAETFNFEIKNNRLPISASRKHSLTCKQHVLAVVITANVAQLTPCNVVANVDKTCRPKSCCHNVKRARGHKLNTISKLTSSSFAAQVNKLLRKKRKKFGLALPVGPYANRQRIVGTGVARCWLQNRSLIALDNAANYGRS